MGLLNHRQRMDWLASPAGQKFFGRDPATKAQQAARAEASDQLLDDLAAHGAGHPGVRRRGYSVTEFRDAFAADKAAGLHDMQPSREPDHNALLGEELEQHPLRPTPIIRGA